MTDWLPELSDDDLNTLVEALEAWELKDQASEMFGDVIDSVIGMGSPHAKGVIAEQRQGEKLTRKREGVARKERSVLLRAKLLTLRDRRRVERTITKADPSTR